MFMDGQKVALAERLERALIDREVRAGFAILDDSFAAGLRITPEDSVDFDLLVSLAQWVDLGYRTLGFFEQHLLSFKTPEISQAGVAQYMRLKLAESFQMLAAQQPVKALRLLSALLEIGDRLFPQRLLFVIHFWKGRAHRQSGDFQQALTEIHQARTIAESMQAEKLVAVARIHESWLMFHKGDRRLAFDLLDQAEEVLLPTGHALSLGNIAAARGRFVRQSGQYAKALTYFEDAITLYRESYSSHPNLARALVNAAYLKRLIALEAQRNKGGKANAASHSKVLLIAREAMDLLNRAEKIYAQHQHQAGTGSVLINLGHLQLESGDIDAARQRAQAAYRMGEDNGDTVLMTRARILQAYVQMACSEEGIEEPSSPFPPAQNAVQLADEAVSLAHGTQHRRLLAGAYITRGLAATDELIADWSLAATCATRAEELLGSEDHDHLVRELSSLRRKIALSRSANEVFEGWLAGEFGGKSFQEIEAEFAQLVVPKVWVNLGRSVSRVAQELSMSPKKVRRILRNTHMLE